tara:strand:- start:6279 stop:6428 length:150 start_codon:yes stop_codon:yes gene_type:complete
MKYTREQFVKAQLIWNTNYVNNPEGFEEQIELSLEYAEEQIDHLISLIK